MSRVQRRAEEMISQHGFLGVPIETFERGGRRQLIALLAEGMTPEATLVEFGCGCLRVAYWLMRFLDPGCYFGIEPARQRVQLGLEYLFTPEEIQQKRPRFDYNAEFNSSVFQARFDFFLAGSIWTHASKPQIVLSLDSFTRDASEKGIFLTSYLPARTADEDYLGPEWVGTSHESTVPGIVRHSLDWIRAQCTRRNLQLLELPDIDCDGQYWLRISRS